MKPGSAAEGGAEPSVVQVFNRRKLRSPIVVAAALVAFALWQSEWVALVGLALVYLGWCCGAPNLNLADGCLPILAIGVTLAIAASVGSAGLFAAGAACAATWVMASLESASRCRRVESPAQPAAAADERREP